MRHLMKCLPLPLLLLPGLAAAQGAAQFTQRAITLTQDPVAATDAVRKGYLDQQLAAEVARALAAEGQRATASALAAETARAAEPGLLRMAKVELPATSPFGNHVAFRARLSGLTRNSATDACVRLKGRGTPCMTVPPVQDAS